MPRSWKFQDSSLVKILRPLLSNLSFIHFYWISGPSDKRFQLLELSVLAFKIQGLNQWMYAIRFVFEYYLLVIFTWFLYLALFLHVSFVFRSLFPSSSFREHKAKPYHTPKVECRVAQKYWT
jgi:hypothetical protein